MDIGEGMCYGECCELCKTDDSQTCTLKQIIHYMLIKKRYWFHHINLFTSEKMEDLGNSWAQSLIASFSWMSLRDGRREKTLLQGALFY